MIRVFTRPRPTQHDEAWSCKRKHRYNSISSAKEAAKALTKRQKKRMCVYHCFYCTHWHVGTDRTEQFKKLNRLKLKEASA